MNPCIRCHRHVRRAELCCPFCGAALVEAVAPVGAAAWGLCVALLVACGPGKSGEASGGSSGASEGDSSGEVSTGGVTTGGGSTGGAPTSGAVTGTSSASSCGDDCTASNEAAGFIYGAPDGGLDPEIECDVFAQDCGPGKKCTAWADNGGGAWNATKCVEVTGDKVPGDVCTTAGGGVSGMDDCEVGAMCWNVNDRNEGICVALCTGTPDAPVCDDGFACAIANDGVLNLCLPTCDPLLQDCAGADLCIPNGNNFLCVLDASGAGGKAGDACEALNGCDKGLVCLNTAAASSECMQGATGCCSPFCDFVKQDTMCPPGTECVQWFDPMDPNTPPDSDAIGVCAVKM